MPELLRIGFYQSLGDLPILMMVETPSLIRFLQKRMLIKILGGEPRPQNVSTMNEAAPPKTKRNATYKMWPG